MIHPFKIGILVSLICLLDIPLLHTAEISLENQGEIGAGIFFPSGIDADLARPSPVIQLSGTVIFSRHLGFEAEFHYLPILLEKTVLPSVSHRKATQLALMVGFRLVTTRLTHQASPLAFYVGSRVGFARISVRADSLGNRGGWIGRPIDKIQNPILDPFGNELHTDLFTDIKRQKGLVLSPKIGAQFRVSSRSFLDLSFTPIFIFNRGSHTTQFFFTLSYGRLSQSAF